MRTPARLTHPCQVLLLTAFAAPAALAGVLPEDRADALYHSYDGGGVQITGPSVLVRKQFGEKFSLSGNYYVDTISSASIDVVTTASPYDEERTQVGAGIDYLRGKTLMSLGYSNSEENDFTADTAYFTVSQDMFGDLTTVSLGFSRGWDEVRRRGDMEFSEDNDRRQYRVDLSQIVTKNMTMAFSFETITDEGFLNNPYRSVRYLDPESAQGFSYEPELYPNTRTSTAGSVRSRYYLPYRAALHGGYRYFTDTWGIQAHTAEVGYTHPLKLDVILDLKYRYYDQSGADFYMDLFPRAEAFNFRARDKELSTFSSQTFHLGVSWEFARKGWKFLGKGALSASWDHFMFDYQDFRDITEGGAPGDEPLYDLSADVFQIYVSLWY